MFSPGRPLNRSRNTHTKSSPPSLAVTCVLYPVGSTTSSAGIADDPSLMCPGRTPNTISEPIGGRGA
jgi:hypothetical protein